MNEKYPLKHFACILNDVNESYSKSLCENTHLFFLQTHNIITNGKVAWKHEQCCYFSSLIINLKTSFPFRVSSYIVDGGLSGDTLLAISPALSSSTNLLANVRLLIFGVNNSSSSLNFLGPFWSARRTSSHPFFASIFNNFRPYFMCSVVVVTFIYFANICHLVTKKSLSDKIMQRRREYLLKYPELIAYYRKKGYKVETDEDLRDVHAWIPLELYSKLMAKSSTRFSQERGRISKAVAEALERWLTEEQNSETE